MGIEIFQRSVRIERPAAEVFAWHERPGAFARLAPPWERVEVVSHVGGIRDGARVSLRAKAGPLWLRWELEHRDYIAGRQFRDVLLSGPFARWEHLHLIEPAGENACVLTDEIRYRLPLGAAGRVAGGAFTRRRLERMFAYRHAVTKADIEGTAAGARLCVLVSGASGLVGRSLVAYLQTQGHAVRRLVRGAARTSDEFSWDPKSETLDPAALTGVDAVVHLAGENIAGGRWTEARKARILRSRVLGTRAIVQALAACPAAARPKVLVSASAVGFYGDRRDERLGEDAGRGAGFLADVCEVWEREAVVAEQLGVRAVVLRTGVVLTPAGGALAKMLPAFRAGVAGRLGSGRQWMSWIAPDDLVLLYERAMLDPAWRGAINAVAPEPVTNAVFTATLARVLRRPALLPLPAAVLRFIFGRMADATLLASTRAVPTRLHTLGLAWRHPDLESALRFVLGK